MRKGSNLLEEGMFGSVMFYFNLKGSTNKKDVKLVACLGDQSTLNMGNLFVYFDNDNTNTWQNMNGNQRFKWDLLNKSYYTQMSCDFWVSVVFFVFCVVCANLRKNGNKKKK